MPFLTAEEYNNQDILTQEYWLNSVTNPRQYPAEDIERYINHFYGAFGFKPPKYFHLQNPAEIIVFSALWETAKGEYDYNDYMYPYFTEWFNYFQIQMPKNSNNTYAEYVVAYNFIRNPLSDITNEVHRQSGSPYPFDMGRLTSLSRAEFGDKVDTNLKQVVLEGAKAFPPKRLLQGDIVTCDYREFENSISAPRIGHLLSKHGGLFNDQSREVAWSMLYILDSASYITAFKDFCFVVPKPIIPSWDHTVNALHNEDGPALIYGGGIKLWFINGCKVTERAVMSPETYTVDEIDKISNGDERQIVTRRFGYDRYIKETNSVCIDFRQNDVENTMEALYRTPQGMVLSATCPTGRLFFMPIADGITTCAQGKDWLAGGKEFNVIART